MALHRFGLQSGRVSVDAMGNSLLDFVMALVRDPDVAARYAADPAGALASAGLPGVTITDVQNLIPVVTDSLAMTTPSFGDASFGDGTAAVNVWTSGAAAAALDAFHVPHPAPAVNAPVPRVDVGPISEPHGDPVPHPTPVAALAPDPAAAALDHQLVDPVIGGWAEGGGDGGWHQTHDLQLDHPPADHPGFDPF